MVGNFRHRLVRSICYIIIYIYIYILFIHCIYIVFWCDVKVVPDWKLKYMSFSKKLSLICLRPTHLHNFAMANPQSNGWNTGGRLPGAGCGTTWRSYFKYSWANLRRWSAGNKWLDIFDESPKTYQFPDLWRCLRSTGTSVSQTPSTCQNTYNLHFYAIFCQRLWRWTWITWGTGSVTVSTRKKRWRATSPPLKTRLGRRLPSNCPADRTETEARVVDRKDKNMIESDRTCFYLHLNALFDL